MTAQYFTKSPINHFHPQSLYPPIPPSPINAHRISSLSGRNGRSHHQQPVRRTCRPHAIVKRNRVVRVELWAPKTVPIRTGAVAHAPTKLLLIMPSAVLRCAGINPGMKSACARARTRPFEEIFPEGRRRPHACPPGSSEWCVANAESPRHMTHQPPVPAVPYRSIGTARRSDVCVCARKFLRLRCANSGCKLGDGGQL